MTEATGTHPARRTVIAYALDLLPADDRAQITAHLERCPGCLDRLSAVGR